LPIVPIHRIVLFVSQRRDRRLPYESLRLASLTLRDVSPL
jgi:hypothetical protein